MIKMELNDKWLSLLWKKLVSIKKKREKDLDLINDTILFSDPLDLAKVYVEPNCQEINPADRHDEDFFTSREPLFKKVSEFLRIKSTQKGSNQLFLLSDAGMGKTSFLVMFKLLHFTSFWPKSYHCVLLKLGEDTIKTLEETENKRNTVLLLDSLDEDTLAYGKTKERLLEILNASCNFYKVIITCRTQFFPYSANDPLEYPGRVRIGGYICASKYISLFDNIQVDDYLQRKFPPQVIGFPIRDKKISQAKSIVTGMSSLRCRPMLLSFIEDLIDSPKAYSNGTEYVIYDTLVKSWLLREETKTGFDSEVLLRACSELAYEMQTKKQVIISQDQLLDLIGKINFMQPIKAIDITGRSLLNRNSAGDYRFSHYSIQEFLVVYYLFNFVSIKESKPIYPTDFIKKLIEQNKAQLKIKLQEEMFNQFNSIENIKNPFLDVKEYSFMAKAEVEQLVKNLLPDLEDLEINPYENSLDIPTFLRKKLANKRTEENSANNQINRTEYTAAT